MKSRKLPYKEIAQCRDYIRMADTKGLIRLLKKDPSFKEVVHKLTSLYKTEKTAINLKVYISAFTSLDKHWNLYDEAIRETLRLLADRGYSYN